MIRRLGAIALMGMAMVLGFSLLMIAVYALPNARMKLHALTAVKQIEGEGTPYYAFFGLWAFSADTYTDALMLNEALGARQTSPIVAAFENRMLTLTSWPRVNTVADLEAAVEGGGRPFSYATYWHGYQVVLRPLLLFLDYRAIRWLNSLVLYSLIAGASVAIGYRLGWKAAIALLAALLAVSVLIVPISIALSGVFYVALGGVVFVALSLGSDNHLRLDLETFFVLGGLTSFVDLLSAPLITLGLPLVVVLVARMASDHEHSVTREWWYSAKTALAWGCGYAGMWASKWLLSSAILGRNVFSEAVASAGTRLFGDEPGITIGPAADVVHNVLGLLPVLGWHKDPAQWDVIIAACSLLAIPVVVLLALLVKHRRTDGFARRVLGLLLVAVLPLAWYVIFYNHSSIHYFMTYRSLSATVFAVAFSVLYLFDPVFLSSLKTALAARLRGV